MEKKALRHELARHIENIFNLDRGWMDHPHETEISPLDAAITKIQRAFSEVQLSEDELELIREYRALDTQGRIIHASGWCGQRISA